MIEMTETMDYLFGPIGREYCMYFYFLSILAFVLFVLSAAVIVNLAVKGKKFDAMNSFIMLFQPFLLYFVNRIFYSMCVNSLV
jgi:hypothetical protein